MKLGTLFKVIKQPYILIGIMNRRGLLNWVPDEIYLEWRFKKSVGYELNLEDPVTFNEKMQWLKVNDRNPLYSKIVDKYEVRSFVSNLIGEDYLIPLYSVNDSFDEIDFDKLPNQFVIKTTHDSGGVVICKDKNKFNLENARKIINKSMKVNYYHSGREWPYKGVKPRVIVEKYMEDTVTGELRDYKFFTFAGKAKMLFVASERGTNTSFDFYDLKFNHIPVKQHYPNSKKTLVKPVNFEKMIELAEEMAKFFPHVRVDFYEVNNRIYFGELTLTHFSGFYKFEPVNYDELFGSYLDINTVKKNKKLTIDLFRCK